MHLTSEAAVYSYTEVYYSLATEFYLFVEMQLRLLRFPADFLRIENGPFNARSLIIPVLWAILFYLCYA